MSKRPVLVTGGTGFIGQHLLKQLLDVGENILLLTRPSSIVSEFFANQVTRVECTDWSVAGLTRALVNCDFSLIYHLVSYGVAPVDRNIMSMVDINASLPVALVILAAEREAGMVMMGSCSEYMRPSRKIPLTEEAPLESGKLYGTSKAAGGLLASAAAHRAGVDLRILRLFNAYGPGEASHRLLPSLYLSLQKGQHVSLSHGVQVRDFIYVKDVVEAILLAGDSISGCEKKNPVKLWNICTGSGTTVRNFAEKVASFLEVPNKLLVFGDISIREDEVSWMVGAPDKIQSELGWRARYDLDSGLQDALATMSAVQTRQ